MEELLRTKIKCPRCEENIPLFVGIDDEEMDDEEDGTDGED